MYASKELGAELWELSGWVPDRTHFDDHGDKVFDYSLGFILRKLPKFFYLERNVNMKPSQQWMAYHSRFSTEYVTEYADTPEDAACKLAISLFQQNILQRSTHDAA